MLPVPFAIPYEGRMPSQDGDVVGGGIGAGVARPQQSGQGFAGRGLPAEGRGSVQEAQQWVVAEASLVCGCCLLFFGVAGHQGGVEVQDQAGQVAPTGAGREYAALGLGGLQPGDVPGGRSR
jgi:hypothetical protein